MSPLGSFLRSRRARIHPGEAGLPDAGGIRRVAGLRREELAQLAGISVDYYVRLEQGRSPNVSHAILTAIASALRLDQEEREYLFRLAHPPRSSILPASRLQPRPEVHRMLEWISAPALVMCPRLDILAWNRAATELIGEFSDLPEKECNYARLQLADRSIGARYNARHDLLAQDLAALLRVTLSLHPADARLLTLVDELREQSVEFSTEWENHPVHVKYSGTHWLKHSVYGDMTLSYEITKFPHDHGQTLIIYTAPEGTTEHVALRQIASDPGPRRTFNVASSRST
ncbi:helix-turn-helix transcriptional regulator [Nocardia wallacei]|nr:helix-turn-helix transcriptional regulator [Nocardia wallacei]